MKRPIYFILEHLKTGGIEIIVTDLANALVERGYQVTILVMFSDNEIGQRIDSKIKIEILTPFDTRHQSLLYKAGRRLGVSILLKRRLKRIHDSAIISSTNRFSLMISKYVGSDCLRIFQLHHDYINRRSMINDIRNRYNNIDYFVTLTDDINEEISKLLSINNHHTQCVTIPNFYPGKIKDILSWDQRKDYVLAVGRLDPIKGFMRLCEVWKLIQERCGDKYKLYIAGDGFHRSEIERKINELEMQDTVKLLGMVSHNEVERLMSESLIYCMSSYSEAFSLVLLEAMAHGTPQVAFDVRVGPRNLIIDGKTGFLVEDDDKRAYADRILTLMDNRDKWEMMSLCSNESSFRFSKESVLGKWEALLNR